MDWSSNSKNINLKSGQPTEISFTSILPSCSGCAGITAGKYPLKVEVMQSQFVIAKGILEIILKDKPKEDTEEKGGIYTD